MTKMSLFSRSRIVSECYFLSVFLLLGIHLGVVKPVESFTSYLSHVETRNAPGGALLIDGGYYTIPRKRSALPTQSSSTSLFGKKKKGGSGGGGYSSSSQQPQQEKKSVQEARFDANTRQFMFTLSRLSKILPDKSKKILDDINLSFYPGAKIGVVGLNGSGYVIDR
jgi:ABC-type multidrug transport system fused ATPase/permease subunit